MVKQSKLSSESEARLWQQWTLEKDHQARRELIDHYLPFAQLLAAKLYAGRQIPDIEFEEYRQYAIVGLIESIDRYEPQQEASFKTYASHRIKGAVINGIEKYSEKQQQITARAQLQQQRLKSLRGDKRKSEKGKDAFQEMVDLAIGLALGYMLEDSGMYQAEEETYTENFYDRHELSQLKQAMKQIVDVLPEQPRSVITYHYYQGLSFDEIAGIMKLTNGRVSQIHRQALKLMQEVYSAGQSLNLKL